MSSPSAPRPNHTFFTNARNEAFAGSTRTILSRLGYSILSAEQLALLTRDGGAPPPAIEMLILDEHRQDVPDEVDPQGTLPIILLTGRSGIRKADPKIIAALKRPAGLHGLYRIFQQHFEERPRTTPRVDTELEVRCHRRGKTWSAAIISLSDNGCLLRGDETVPLGSSVEITLTLPNVASLQIEAEAAYQLVPDLGLVFSGITPGRRDAIGAYVLDRLDAHLGGGPAAG